MVLKSQLLLLLSPSYLNEIIAGYSNLGCRLFSFITLSMSCHSLLAWIIYIERSAVILMGIPFCVICCFSLADFNIYSLCWIFVILINMCLVVFCLGFILFGISTSAGTWEKYPGRKKDSIFPAGFGGIWFFWEFQWISSLILVEYPSPYDVTRYNSHTIRLEICFSLILKMAFD